MNPMLMLAIKLAEQMPMEELIDGLSSACLQYQTSADKESSLEKIYSAMAVVEMKHISEAHPKGSDGIIEEMEKREHINNLFTPKQS